MKTKACPFRWLILGVAATAAAAQTEIVTLGEQGWREQVPALSVASGGSLMLSVLIPAALNAAGATVELWQVAGASLIPLEKNRPLSAVAQPGSPNAQGVTVLRLTFPEVERKTQVLVKFILADEPQADAGRAQVWVYPPINWAPLAKRFKEGAPRLVLFGDSAGLREFLKRNGLVFEDRGPDAAGDVEPGALAIGVLSTSVWDDQKARLRVDGRLLVFTADAPGLPGVYTMADGGGVITRVTLPVIENLDRDARAADLFLQLIEQHLHATPSALPSL